MAYTKKHYRSTDPKTNRHQKRGGENTPRKNRTHRYATRPLSETSPGQSPTYLAAIAAKKLKV